MAGLAIDGLVSGLSTSALVNQLMTIEAQGQTALKTRKDDTTKAAAAYRAVNTKFDALRTLAAEFSKPGTWNPTSVTSSATSVAVSSTTGAQPGQVSFSVTSLASSHSVLSAATWGATSEAFGLASPIEVFDENGASTGTITVGGTGTLADAVKAINASDKGLSAAAIQVSPGQYRLAVTAKDSGAAGAFTLGDATGSGFSVTTAGADARIRVGTTNPFDVTSATNTFKDVLPGVSMTVSKVEADVTVKVANDPEAVAKKVQELVDAANGAISEVKRYASSNGGSAAILKGDFALTRLTGEILGAVSSAVAGSGSPGSAGVELTRDGTIKFTKDKFLEKLAADPAAVQRLLAGTPANLGADGVKGTADDGAAAIPGVAMRLEALAKSVSDKTTGSLVLLAKGRDDMATDLQRRIDSWDQRLELRRTTLNRQFTALETALSKMQNQSSWLSSSLNSLPSTSA